MSGIMSMQIPTYGMQQYNKGLAEGKQQGINEERARGGLIIGGHVATIVNLQKHRNALADPTAALAGPGAPGNLTQAIDDAVLVALSAAAAHAGHVGTNAEKIAALEAIDGASAAGTDDVANSAVRTALGLDSTVLNFAATKPEVTRFIKLAKTELVKTPARKVTIVNLTKHRDALADPNAALTAAGPGTLTQAITDAKADGASAANPLPIGTVAEKIAALKAIEAIASPGAEDNYKRDIRIALGLKSDPAALGAVAPETAAVTQFREAATRQEKTPARKAAIVNLKKYADAIEAPHTALGGGQPLALALGAAALINPSSAHGLPLGTVEEKAAALRATESAHLHYGGGAGILADDNAKAAIRTALGIDPTPANFAATRAQVLAFLIVAEEPDIRNKLAGLGGLGTPTVDKVEAVRTRLIPGTYNATTGAGPGPAGGAADTIAVSLGRLGL